MTIISFAQNGEDVVLERVFRGQNTGFYIDAGAADPVSHSVTKHFYDRGWRGVNIEPMRNYHELLRKARPRDVNLAVGLSNQEGELDFFEGPRNYGGSTFSPEVAESERKQGWRFRKRSVPITTLARVCEEHATEPIDFLKIDVEGHEREVLEGGDFERWRPRILVVEATVPHTNIPNHDHWEKLLLDADYCFASFDGINRFYVRVEDRELAETLALPLNFLDDYKPYEHVHEVEAIQGRLDQSESLRQAAEAACASLTDQLTVSGNELAAARQQMAANEQALAETRTLLSTSQMAVQDFQVQLMEVQKALIQAHHELRDAIRQLEEHSGAQTQPGRGYARLWGWIRNHR